MQIEVHVEALRNDLASVASLGDEAAGVAAARIAAALDSSFRLRLLEIVGEAAQELSGQIGHGRIEVRLVGNEPSLVFVEDEPMAEPTHVADDASARITLRLPENLKARVEAAANGAGVSVNTWLVQAIARSLDARPRRVGKHLTGFAQS
jgi:hypothetical protein